MEDLRYPIGKFNYPSSISSEQINEWIDVIEQFPDRLSAMVNKLDESQLNTAYRPGGWTVRQLVNHISDSHLNSQIRFKWTMTENKPIIKTYNEKAWAELQDALEGPADLALDLIHAIHRKWVYFLKTLKADDWKREFEHPDSKRIISLEQNLALYAWHCNHHYAHIEALIKRENW